MMVEPPTQVLETPERPVQKAGPHGAEEIQDIVMDSLNLQQFEEEQEEEVPIGATPEHIVIEDEEVE